MKNKDQTKEQLLEEIEHLKVKIAQQKKSDAENKKMITALKESEEKYRTIVESSNDIIFQIDTHGKLIFANEHTRTWLGYNEGDGLGKSFTHFVPKREIPRYLKQLAKVISGVEVHNFITSVYHKDGHLVPIEISGKLIKQQGKTIAQGVVRDLSLRMAAQKATRESNRLLREAAQIAHLGYWDLDIETYHLQWSKEVYKMFGIVSKKFEATYDAFLKFIHPDDRDFVVTAFSDSLKNKTPFDVIHRVVLHSGEIKYVHEKCRTVYNKSGKAVRSVGIILDITQQMDAELDLQKSRAYLLEIFNATTDAIFIHDGETGKILDVNEQMCTLYGYDKEEVLLSSIRTYSLGTSPYSNREAMEWLVKSRNEGTQNFEWLARHKDGHLFWVEVSLRFTTIGGEKRYIASVKNIEDRKQAEDRIHHLNRVYAALSHVNKTIVRVKERKQLLDEACKIAIDDGKFMMSWIGIVNPENHQVEVVSSYGKTADYLENVNIDMSDIIRRSGPTGTAIHTGKHTYSNDIETDPKMDPWRKKALSLGYKSSIALPLTIGDKTIGAYMIYSAEKNFFNTTELDLLDEMASDISFALEYIEKEKQRKKMEAALFLSNKRYQSLFSDSPIPLWEEDFSLIHQYFNELKAKGISDIRTWFADKPDELSKLSNRVKVVDVNKATLKLHKAEDKADLLGNLQKIFTKKSWETFKEEMMDLFNGQTEFESEAEVKTLHGEKRDVFLSLKIDKSVAQWSRVLLATLDITDQKNMKRERQTLQQHLTNTLEFMTDGFIMLDNNWNYLFVNGRAGEMLGKDPESLIGKHIWTEFPEGINQPFYKNYYQAVETQETITMEAYYPPWDRWFENRIVPTKTGLSIFFQDVTERKKAEQQIRQANARLEIIHHLDRAILESISVETIAQSSLKWLHQISKAIRISIALFDEEENRATVYSRGLLQEELGHAQEVSLQSSFPDISGMKKGKIIKISNLNTEKKIVEIMQRFKKEGILSFVNIPILSQGKLLGSLNFGYKNPDGFTNDNLEIGKEVANSLAIAIEQARLHRTLKMHAQVLEQNVRELTYINKLSNKLKKSTSLTKMSHEVVEEVRSATHADVTLFYLLRDNKLQLVEYKDSSAKFELEGEQSHRVGECLCGQAAGTGVAIFSEEINDDVRCTLNNCKNIGIKSFASLPLLAENKIIGVIGLGYFDKQAFTNKRLIETFVNEASAHLYNVLLLESLKKHELELEEKVAERTAQLEHSNNELREFAQVVSHDLKAPLRAISQLSYWLSQDYSDTIDAEGQQQLKLLIGRVKRLDNLIDGILKYSRAGKMREKEKTIDLQKLIEQTVTLLNPPATIKITIEDQLPTLVGDPTRMGQLFQNLIDNAIKYMDKPQGVIKIGCKKRAEYWEFYVSDNGPGIEEKYFDRIFQIFQRLVARDSMEGTGVGLSLVKRIVQIYGGDIWIKSKLGEGTTFYFTLAVGKKEKSRKA